jgi:predicted ribosomally synthesized peptide with SipW-like signal peptide
MSTKRILAAALVIVVVSALVTGGTIAYFSGTADQNTTVTTATINIGGAANFPLDFLNMLPGESQSKEVAVQNGGSRPADLYVQLLSTSDGTNFCVPNDVLRVKIQQINGWGGAVIGTWYNDSICKLFPGWSGSTIAKVADNVAAGDWAYFRVTLTLDATAGNAYQGASNTDTVHMIAVQYDGPAPVPDNDGGASQAAWPDDPYGDDDDPNYP